MSRSIVGLTRGQPIGYDQTRMVYKFSMSSDDKLVICEISNAALSDLGKRWININLDYDAVFTAHRDLIEAVACRLYRQGRQQVRIFAKDLGLRRAKCGRLGTSMDHLRTGRA